MARQHSNPRLQSRALTRTVVDEEVVFTQVVQCCIRLHKAGIPIAKDTLEHELEQLVPFLARQGIDPPTGPELEEYLASQKLANALEARGVSWHPLDLLTPEQYAAAAIYMDTSTNASHAQRLRMAGLTQAKWDGWMRTPRFAALVQELSEERLATMLPIAHQKLLEAVGDGKPWAIKLLYEVTGRHVASAPGQDPAALLMTMYAVMEEAHVPPEIMRRVGEKLRDGVGAASTVQRAPQTMMIASEPEGAAHGDSASHT